MAWPPKIAHAKPHERPQGKWVQPYVEWRESLRKLQVDDSKIRLTAAFEAGYKAGKQAKEKTDETT